VQDRARGRASVVSPAPADRVAAIKRGCVSASGTHAELLTRSGICASLWPVQTGGALIARSRLGNR